MNGIIGLNPQDCLRLTHSLAQGFLLAVLLMILDSWMPPPGRSDLAYFCLLMPVATGAVVLLRRLGLGPGLQIVASLALAIGGLAWLTASFFNTALSPAQGQYTSGHYLRLVLMLGFAALAWARGWRLAVIGITPKKAVSALQWGLVLIGCLIFIAAQGDNTLGIDPFCTGGFLLFSFGSLWLSQSGRPAENGGYKSQARPGLAAFIFGLCVMGIMAMMLWGFAELGLMQDMEGPIGKVSQGLKWLASSLGAVLVWLFDLLGYRNQLSAISTGISTDPGNLPTSHIQPVAAATSSSFTTVLLVILIAAALTLVFFFLYRLLKWLAAYGKRGRDLDQPQTRGRVEANFRAWLKQAVARLMARLATLWLRIHRLLPWGEPPGVEHYYRRLLIWSGKRGQPRRQSQTPEEFKTHLINLAPDLALPLDTLTRAFVQARYGPVNAQEPAPYEVVSSWKTLRASKSLTGQGGGLRASLQRVLSGFIR